MISREKVLVFFQLLLFKKMVVFCSWQQTLSLSRELDCSRLGIDNGLPRESEPSLWTLDFDLPLELEPCLNQIGVPEYGYFWGILSRWYGVSCRLERQAGLVRANLGVLVDNLFKSGLDSSFWYSLGPKASVQYAAIDIMIKCEWVMTIRFGLICTY